jgi:hypothetical protein
MRKNPAQFTLCLWLLKGLINTAQVELEESGKAERLRIVRGIQNRGLQGETLQMILGVMAYSLLNVPLSQDTIDAENEQRSELRQPWLGRGNWLGAGPHQ